MCQERSPTAQHISTLLNVGTALGPHPGISIYSHFQEKSPPNTTPSQTTLMPQVSGLGRQKAAQLLPTMQPLRRSQSRSEGEGATALPAACACCSPPQLRGHCLLQHLCTCFFALRSQKKEFPSLNSKPRHTPSVLFGENLGGLFAKSAPALCSLLNPELDLAPKK